eukprot:13111191-Ditylum_brightwellii.AAC.1
MATVAHAITGHIGKAQNHNIVKHLGYTVNRGSMPKCEPCTKQKRMHLDISIVKAPEQLNITVVKPQWLLM